MGRFTRRFLSTAVVAVIALTVGVVAGRITASDQQYGPVESDQERMLLGQWKLTADGSQEPLIVEFESDRTAIQYNQQGRPDIRATWGVVNSELSIQNGQNTGVTSGYMPPVVMVIAEAEEDSIVLESPTGRTHWQLERM